MRKGKRLVEMGDRAGIKMKNDFRFCYSLLYEFSGRSEFGSCEAGEER